MSVIGALEAEWQRIGATPAAACAELRRWAVVEPVLGASASPADVLRQLAEPGRGELATGVLGALLHLADDPFAARSLLQAVLPGLKGVLVKGFNGQQLGLGSQRDGDAELVAATWEAIRAHAGESPRFPARYVIGVAVRSLRTRHQVEARRQDHTVALDHERHAPVVELDDARTGDEQLALRIVEAVRSGDLAIEHARLLYATGVVGLRAVDAGRQVSLRPRAVYHALAKAGAELMRATA